MTYGPSNEVKKLRLAVITDDGMIPEFARRALAEVASCEDIYLLSCTNRQAKRRPFRHAFYYLLNLLSIRNSLTRPVPVETAGKRVVDFLRFEALEEGGWQRLPPDVVAWLRETAPDAILKFGMNLLRVPEELTAPILSYHHGNPEYYRGRPAGFYELLHDRPVLGQMVQIIGNRLDAGTVVAFAETKVHRHSYRATLVEAFRHSPLLLAPAISNAIAGCAVRPSGTGRNYRLPSNGTVLRFTLKLLAAKLRRAGYGAFWEKAWRVSFAPAANADAAPHLPIVKPDHWTTLPNAPGCRFLADPFFSKEQGGILVEALNVERGMGEILLWNGDGYQRVLELPGHVSYPATTLISGREVFVPEIASWSGPRAYGYLDGAVRELAQFKIPGREPVLDPTLVQHEGRLYLFGNVRRYPNALFLWSAASMEEEFVRHPASPVLISPQGARMGGAVWEAEGRLYRLGQSWLSSYGDGLFCFRIEQLSAADYQEAPLGELRFGDRKGPHTLNKQDQRLVFDWYLERFSLTAGLRRAITKVRS